MTVQLVFETHSLSKDNESGRASGWLPGRLSRRGRALAAELGERRAGGGLAAVFSSDLRRAVETAEIAFAHSDVPVLLDWRLRECDYGALNGAAAGDVHAERSARLDTPYPHGESWREAVERGGWFLRDVRERYDDASVLVIGHVATRWALDHFLLGVPLDDLVRAPFEWREGWSYDLMPDAQLPERRRR